MSSVPSFAWETTPNENAMRLAVAGMDILPASTEIHGLSVEQSSDVALLDGIGPHFRDIVQLPGVVQLYLGNEFISLTRDSTYGWDELLFAVGGHVQEAILEARNRVGSTDQTTPSLVDPTKLLKYLQQHDVGDQGGGSDSASDLQREVEDVIEMRIRPSVQADGGDVFLDSIDETRGIAFVRLAGSCVGCGQSEATLKDGIERVLALYVPAIEAVEHVQDTPLDIASAQALEQLEARLAARRKSRQ